MSKESRAANLAKAKERQAALERIRKTEGWRAFHKAVWANVAEEFNEKSWWGKPLYIIRNLITVPIIIAIFLVIIIISFFVGMVGFIGGLYIDYFWKSFAITCLALGIIVLFATGVF